MVISLGDLELAVDYINNRDVIKDELKKTKNAQSSHIEVTSQGSSASPEVAGIQKQEVSEEKEVYEEDIEIDDEEFEVDDEEFEVDDEEIEADEEFEVDAEGFEVDDEEIAVEETDDDDIGSIYDEPEDSQDEYEEEEDYVEEVKATPTAQVKVEPKQQGTASVLSPLDLLQKKKGLAGQQAGSQQVDRPVQTGQKPNEVKTAGPVQQPVQPKQVVEQPKQPNLAQTQQKQPRPQGQVVSIKRAQGNIKSSEQPTGTLASRVVDNYKHSVDKQVHPVGNIQKKDVQNTASKDVSSREVNADASRVSMYSAMDEKALYKEVKKFLESRHVAKAPVDRKIVEAEFGVDNVLKLIKRGYLVSVGRGITIGY
jgi:hypothetical protein